MVPVVDAASDGGTSRAESGNCFVGCRVVIGPVVYAGCVVRTDPTLLLWVPVVAGIMWSRFRIVMVSFRVRV